MAIKLDNYYEEEKQNQIKRATAVADKQKTNVNTAYDAQIKRLTDSADKQIISAENSYDAAYADNAVQKAINEREITESMANAGMQDSGLNRTQLTAVNLQKANADNNTTHNKTLFINKIRAALQEGISTAEQQRTQELNNINTQLMAEHNDINNTFDSQKISKLEEITSNIATITDPTIAAGYIKAVSKQYGINGTELARYSPVVTRKSYEKYLDNENYFVNKNAYKSAHSNLSTIDTTNAAGQTTAAKQIKAYANTTNATKTKIKKLCESAGISYSEYTKFLKDGQYFVKREEEKALRLARLSSGGSGGSYDVGASYDITDSQAYKELTAKLQRRKDSLSNMSYTDKEYLDALRLSAAEFLHTYAYGDSVRFSEEEAIAAVNAVGYSKQSLEKIWNEKYPDVVFCPEPKGENEGDKNDEGKKGKKKK